MSKITNRVTALRDGASVEQRLARLLEAPFLARVVPHLPPETLHQLITHSGLEACGELVAAATPAQLNSLLDLDLWRHDRPGRSDERFDVERFGEWVEMLVDTDPSLAARTVAVLDKDVVVAGLSRYVRVFDPGIFEPIAQSDDEPADRHGAMRDGDSQGVAEAMHADTPPGRDSSSDALECEVGGYLVRARRTDAWDAVIALLIALDAEQGTCFHTVMRGCRHLSNSRPEIGGLDDLLQAPEQHLHDVTIEREGRRSQQGYATPADARAFLKMARQSKRSKASMAGAIKGNPIVTAYFRAADEGPESSTSPPAPKSLPAAESRLGEVPAHATDGPESIEAVMELLTEAGMMPERPRALLDAADTDPQAARLAHLRRLMTHVRDTDETVYFTRSRELAFLANALLAGCPVQSRPFTPQEASDAAAGICNLGLEHSSAPDSFLIDHDLVAAFEAGWLVLHREVSLFAAQQLIATLKEMDCADREIQRGLIALRRTLEKQRKAGTPWLAREAAEVLAMLDMTAWIGVLGLLDECPIMPAALMAVVEGRTTAVSPTEFDFISTAAQIADVRLFMRKLPDLLSG